MNNCILCGTEIEEDYCFECDNQAQDMGLDYIELTEAL